MASPGDRRLEGIESIQINWKFKVQSILNFFILQLCSGSNQIAMKEGLPFLAFSVQGGDTQDQNLLQFLLNMVEWKMNPQEAAEAANINSFQMRGSFKDHPSEPGKLRLRDDVSPWVRAELETLGYKLEFKERTSGPITAIWFDREHGSMWGAASNYGDDYGIDW